MGWNCACNGGSGDKRIKHYEWPVEVAECHAALSTCNGSCALKSNGNDRVACFTGCTSSYPCNTIEAPFSNLRVKSVYDKPAGYMPPLEDKDIELTIGMKFGADTPGMDDADKRAQKTNDPGRLPKIVPRSDDDDDDSVAKPGRGKGKNKGGNGSYRKGAHPGNADGGQLASGAVHATGQCANKVALLVAAAVAGVLSFA
ncbi:hypothetical protein LPJ53_002228 [Coemansia erecta]|uniref:Uncharacterized protein n=1 Tax=Coemansia erecta TaxID=147472 RepID=A0A9W8CTQ1_9FUNG|nr:hypothetical protein LPJ53_002228 [Coemansia erecta]